MKLDRHLLASDFERYLDQSDLSEIYLYWLEPVAEHLDQCAACQEKLQRIIKMDWMLEEGLPLVADAVPRESDIRRMSLASRLRQLYLEQERELEGYRMQHLMYHILQNSIYKTTKTQRDQLRPSAFTPPFGASMQNKAFSMSAPQYMMTSRPTPSSESSSHSAPMSASMSFGTMDMFQKPRLTYSDGVLHVETSVHEANVVAVTVMLEGKDKGSADSMLMVKEATRAQGKYGVWEADFAIPDLQEEYQVYFDVIRQ